MPRRKSSETMTVTMPEEAEVTPEETPETEAETTTDPFEAIAESFEGAPAVETMRAWKEQYGAVFAFSPDPVEIFLFRSLRRLEHKTISASVRQLSDSQAAAANPSMVEEQLHEKVLTACLLHPAVTVDMLSQSDAGLIPTLFNLVMENSKFITPEKALANTFRL